MSHLLSSYERRFIQFHNTYVNHRKIGFPVSIANCSADKIAPLYEPIYQG